MRTIIINDDIRVVELWPGRRLYLESADGVALYALPRGSMSQMRGSLSFGSTNRTTVRLEGTPKTIATIAKAILAAELTGESLVHVKGAL